MFCCINIFFLFHPISFRVLSFLSAPDAASCLLVLAHSSNFVVAIANLLFVGLWGGGSGSTGCLHICIYTWRCYSRESSN